METAALIIGIVAVILLFLSYQQKKRANIIAFNIACRVLFILQYVFLGAFEGAALDIAAIVASWLAQKKNKPIIQKFLKPVIVLVDLGIIAVGLFLYQDLYSLLPIAAVLFQTTAFWLDTEKAIRIVSLAGAPFWLVYNLASGAVGSVIGDTLTVVSLVIAMLRYDFKLIGKSKETE